MRFESLVVVAMALGAATGCSSPMNDGIVCPDIFIPGLAVTVVDSASGAGVAAGATVIARDGAFADSTARPATGSDTAPFSLAGRAGAYSLTVRKSGYGTWTKNGIQVVNQDACFVKTVSVTAKLQPGG
jgi:hypothetical protein